MALGHDIAARLFQRAATRFTKPRAAQRFSGQDLPPPETITAETEAGPLRAMLYRPPGAGPDAPLYINFHGGGFVLRAPEQDDPLCRHIAAELGCVVLNPDYDTAPQARFPTAATQAQALCWWAAFNGRKLGWDGKRIAIGGQSAGGNLAIGACLELPARGAFKPLGVIVVYPLLDLVTAPANKPTARARPRISRTLAAMFAAAYLPDRAGRAAPLASPLYADDLTGFPPALIVVAEHDMLRAEGEVFAGLIEAAGAEVRLERAAGADHSFLLFGSPETARTTLDAMVNFLAERFAARPGAARA